MKPTLVLLGCLGLAGTVQVAQTGRQAATLQPLREPIVIEMLIPAGQSVSNPYVVPLEASFVLKNFWSASPLTLDTNAVFQVNGVALMGTKSAVSEIPYASGDFSDTIAVQSGDALTLDDTEVKTIDRYFYISGYLYR